MNAKLANLDEMSKELSMKDSDSCKIFALFAKFKLGTMLSRYGLEKECGIKVAVLILFACLFRVKGDNVHSGLLNRFGGIADGCKNTYYRLMQRSSMDWRMLLLGVAKRYLKILKDEDKEETERPSCLVLDDTLLEKTGKKIEGVSRVFDHVSGHSTLGFKALVLMFTDSVSNVVVDFCLHREKGKKKDYGLSGKERKEQYSKERDAKSPDYARWQEMDKSKIEVAIDMLRRAWRRGFRPRHVLADTWFTCKELLAAVRQLGRGAVHYVGLAKMGNTKYTINTKDYNAQTLICLHERKAKACRKYKCRYITLNAMLGNVPVRLFLIKYGRRDKWNIMVTTDQKMKFVAAFEIYQLRWNIEVVNKECKGYLALGGSQAQDFNSQIADCALCFITYNILSPGKRLNDYETLGELFRAQREELMLLTLWNRVLECVRKILEQLSLVLSISLDELLEALMHDADAVKQMGSFLCI